MFLSSVKETAGMDFHRVCFWWFSLDHIWCLHCTYFIKGRVNLAKSEALKKFSAFSDICDAELCRLCSFHRHSNFVQTSYRGRTAENHSKQKGWRFRTLVLVDLFANGHVRTIPRQVDFCKTVQTVERFVNYTIQSVLLHHCYEIIISSSYILRTSANTVLA